MNYQDLSAEERAEFTLEAMLDRRTILERWSSFSEKDAKGWPKRSIVLAKMLQDCKAVADVGCGMMKLRDFLPDTTQYVPIDVVSRGPDTIVLDLNQQSLPAIDVDGWVLGGVLEYLFDVPAVMNAVSGTVAVSYNTTEFNDNIVSRRAYAWVNDYDADSLEEIFKASGFEIIERMEFQKQFIWKLFKPQA